MGFAFSSSIIFGGRRRHRHRDMGTSTRRLPLLDRVGFADDAHKARYLRQGRSTTCRPFHHDLYRAVGRGGACGVMGSNSSGPVGTWRRGNPRPPCPDMARLWRGEAFSPMAPRWSANFRWRQAPFGQEQMHTGLLRPDSSPAPALAEAAQVDRELAEMPQASSARRACRDPGSTTPRNGPWEAPAAGGERTSTISRLSSMPDRALRRPWPLGGHPARRCARAFGVPAGAGARTRHAPVRPWAAALEGFEGVAMVGPRAGAKTAEMATPIPLAATPARARCHGGALRKPAAERSDRGEDGGAVQRWFERIEGTARHVLSAEDGAPVLVGLGCRAELPRRLAGRRRSGTGSSPVLPPPPGVAARAPARGAAPLREDATHRVRVSTTAPNRVECARAATLPPAGVAWEPRER